jgi:glycosyltransferase involved in cell wall biosynthesis
VTYCIGKKDKVNIGEVSMRILLITDNHTPTGGAEHYFFDLKDRLKHVPGLDVYSLGFGPTEMAGDDFYILKELRSHIPKLIWRFLLHPIVYIKLRREINKIRPDVIHIHNVKQYPVSVLWAVKPYSVVQTIHDYGVICPTAHNLHKDHQPCSTGLRMACFWQHQVKYNRFIYLALVCSFFMLRNRLRKTVKKFFAPSPLLVEYLKKNNFDDATYIPPFKKEKNHYSFDKMNPHHFLFAGNLGTHKGVHVLIKEFALAVQKNERLTLTMLGMGPEGKSLRKKVVKLGLEKHIFFSGWKENMAPFYEKCAAVIFPSLWVEAFGLVITEAMSHARPVIGSDRGSPPWLIEDQHTGLIFNPLREGDLAEKILTLAGNVEKIKRLGQNGFKKLTSFINNEETVNKIVSLYQASTA